MGLAIALFTDSRDGGFTGAEDIFQWVVAHGAISLG
jgi:hypothetical protein